MPSTYSANLRLELIASGEQGNTWGNTTNNNLGSLLEQAITGATEITSLPATLTALNGASDQSRSMYLYVNAPTGGNIIAPATPKMYIVKNKVTATTDSIVIKTSSSTGITIPNNTTKIVYYSAAAGDFVEAVTAASSLYLSDPISNNAQATTRLYVDTADQALLPRDGSRNMQANLPLYTTTLGSSVPLNTAVPKGYVDAFGVLVNGTAGSVSSASGLINSGGTLQAGTLSLTLAPATSTNLGGVKPNSTQFSVALDGAMTLNPPAGGLIGGVKAGTNITIAGDGTISASGGASGITTVNATSPIQASTVGGTVSLSMISNAYYPYTGNPSGFLTSGALSGYATTSYVNSTVGNYLPLTGGTLSGSVAMASGSYQMVLGFIGSTPAMYSYSNTGAYSILGFGQTGSSLTNRTCMYFSAVDGSMYVTANINAGGTKFFRIPHPVLQNKDLIHASVEAPRADLIYRGAAQLTSGQADVDIDAESRMTSGTFVALTQNAEVVSLYNKDGFTRVRATEVVGGKFTITAEDPACTDIITWVVMAERNDAAMHSNPTCDSDGRLIPEQPKGE